MRVQEGEWVRRARKPMPDFCWTYKIGKWDIGYIYEDFTSEAKGLRYVPCVNLPGIAQMHGHYATEEKAKERLEEVIVAWFDGLAYVAPVEPPAVQVKRRSPPVAKAGVRRR